MKKLLKYLRGYKLESILAPLFKMLEASFELFVPLVMAEIMDPGIANQDMPYIWKMAGVLLLLAVIGLTCSLTAQFFAAKAAVGFAARVKHALFEHIERLSYKELDEVGTSTLITRMTSDMNQVQNGVNMVLRLFLRSPFIVIGAMVMAFYINWKAALIFVVAIPLLSIVVFGIMYISIPRFKKVQEALDDVLGITRQNLTGVRVIRAFHQEEEEEALFHEKNEKLTRLQLMVGRISAIMNPATYIIVNGAVIALLWSGAVIVDEGVLGQKDVVALVNYMNQILVELVKFANLIITITKAVACGNRIQSVFEMEPSQSYVEETAWEESGDDRKSIHGEEAGRDKKPIHGEESGKAGDWIHGDVAETEKAKRLIHEEDSEKAGNPVQGNAFAGDNGDIVVEFKDVSFAYHKTGDAAIEHISIQVKRGETIGIIGGTGSGKSTFVHLIPRFYDATEGQVLVDGIDVTEYPKKRLRDKIGIVMQKAVLFKGTIRENLKWGNEDAKDQDLWDALEIAQGTEVVDKKEHGLDEMITQGGKNLSGGQRQRLTIARALVRKPEILILDDSSSALDYATDAKLRKALHEMKDKPTVFIVSQRTASIQNADRILVFDDGQAVGLGTHEELLASCETYQEIYESQFKR